MGPIPKGIVCLLSHLWLFAGLTGVDSIQLLFASVPSFTVNKFECFKQGIYLKILAWNNEIGLWWFLSLRGGYFVGLHAKVMINRSSWGYSYSIVRGEILGFLEDELLRKHLPRMFSLIKNES